MNSISSGNDFVDEGPRSAVATLLFAHGSGAGMDSPFMKSMSERFVSAELRVVRFEFPYMQLQRQLGKRRPPNPTKLLLQHWRERIEQFVPTRAAQQRCVIGGKSMGGRIASMIADDYPVAGLVAFGFPFQPPKKPNPKRIEHLKQLSTPTLIVQGTRDRFGDQHQVSSESLAKSIRIHWLDDGDHDFIPRKSSGRTADENLQEAADETVDFIHSLNAAAKS